MVNGVKLAGLLGIETNRFSDKYVDVKWLVKFSVVYGNTKEVILVPKVVTREGESFQGTLRRFKKICEKASLLSDIKKNQYFEKPTVERRRLRNAAMRKALKQQRKIARYRKSV